MGPKDIKDDIYNVMTNSRQLTNYCQESVNSLQSKKISNSLNNFHLEKAIDFLTRSLIDQDSSFFELNEIDFDNSKESDNKPIYIKVIEYIENYLLDLNS